MARSRSAVSIVAALALAAAVAGAARAEKPKLSVVAADQAKARDVVVRLDDLGSTTGWQGGQLKPSAPSSLTCAGYNPKQADLVVTGQAKSDFTLPGIEFESEVQLLRTERMVALDWQRTVTAPHVLPCLRKTLVKGLLPSQQLVSFARRPIARLGTYSMAFRAVVSLGAGASRTRVMVDFVLVAVNRTEITLITTARYSEAASVAPAEQRLAQAMVARADQRIA
jgi:hypothetical protein